VTYELPLSQMSVLLVTALRLSPAERGVGVGKTVTLTVLPTDDEQRLAGSPMSESPLALAVSDAPQLDCRVPGC
jgi:hypothetical protein